MKTIRKGNRQQFYSDDDRIFRCLNCGWAGIANYSEYRYAKTPGYSFNYIESCPNCGGLVPEVESWEDEYAELKELYMDGGEN